jgi:hypothetical protein
MAAFKDVRGLQDNPILLPLCVTQCIYIYRIAISVSRLSIAI